MKPKRHLTRVEEVLLRQLFLEHGHPVSDDPHSQDGWVYDTGWTDARILEVFSAGVPTGINLSHISSYRLDVWGKVIVKGEPTVEERIDKLSVMIIETQRNVRNILSSLDMKWEGMERPDK